MKLIIDIPEQIYKEEFENFNGFMSYTEQLIKNGTPIKPCEDCISRASAMTEIMMFACNKKNNDDIYIKVSDAVELMRELPSVTPQELEQGYWIEEWNIDHFEQVCSECGYGEHFKSNYCPNCGAKMESEK